MALDCVCVQRHKQEGQAERMEQKGEREEIGNHRKCKLLIATTSTSTSTSTSTTSNTNTNSKQKNKHMSSFLSAADDFIIRSVHLGKLKLARMINSLPSELLMLLLLLLRE